MFDGFTGHHTECLYIVDASWLLIHPVIIMFVCIANMNKDIEDGVVTGHR